MALIDDIDRESANAKHNSYADGWNAGKDHALQLRAASAQPALHLKSFAEYATHERRIADIEKQVTTTILQRLAKLEADVYPQDADHERRLGNMEANYSVQSQTLQEHNAQLGSLEKDRYEYATLTARVHDLERWRHTGEQPREENPGERKLREARERHGNRPDPLFAFDHLTRRVAQLERHQSETAHFDESIGACEQHCERNESRIGDLENRFEAAGAEFKNCAAMIGTVQPLVEEHAKEFAALEQRVDAVQETLEGRRPSALRRGLDSLDSRLRVVEARSTTMWDKGGYDNRAGLELLRPLSGVDDSVYRQPGQVAPAQSAPVGVDPSVYRQPGG